MKISLGLGVILVLVLLYLFCKFLRNCWMSYWANKDRSYNTFDKAELNSAEKMHMKQWEFAIPEEL